MKLLIYFLFSSLLFLEWCYNDDEENCTTLPSSITVKVYFNLWDNSDGNEACLDKWTVEFFKHHCNGGDGSILNYEYDNCYTDDDDNVYFQRTGIGTWDITFNNEEDYLGFSVIGSTQQNSNPSTYFHLDGKRIYDRTNQGANSLVINIYYDNYGEWTWK